MKRILYKRPIGRIAQQWNTNLRKARKKAGFMQTDLAQVMRDEYGFRSCSQKNISEWENVGKGGEYRFPSYPQMVALAECLDVDVAYLTGDLETERLVDLKIAERLGTDPVLADLIMALEYTKDETIDDDGEKIIVDNGMEAMALFILESSLSGVIAEFRDYVSTYMSARRMDSQREAREEHDRMERAMKIRQFNLIDSFTRMLHERYPMPAKDDEDAYLSEKGKKQAALERQQDEERTRKLLAKMTPEMLDRLKDPNQFAEAIDRITAICQAFASRNEENVKRLRQKIAMTSKMES